MHLKAYREQYAVENDIDDLEILWILFNMTFCTFEFFYLAKVHEAKGPEKWNKECFSKFRYFPTPHAATL